MENRGDGSAVVGAAAAAAANGCGHISVHAGGLVLVAACLDVKKFQGRRMWWSRFRVLLLGDAQECLHELLSSRAGI